MCSCHSILECCVTFSGVKLSIRSFVLFIIIIKGINFFCHVLWHREGDMNHSIRNSCSNLCCVNVVIFYIFIWTHPGEEM